MTTQSDFEGLIETLEDNLQAMGVTDAVFDATTGVIGLADRILDIEPSIAGIDVDTSINITSSSASITYGESIVLESKLIATYNDETLVNVDLSGVLTGATVLFKEGNNILGSGVTDSNGIVTATISNLSSSTHVIKAVFAGTDNFVGCESATVSVTVNDLLTLTSDKDILSYADGDFATLTATLYSSDNVGKTITFEVRKQSDDSLVETLTADTDSSGIATVYYYGKHTYLLYICGYIGNIETNEILIDVWPKYDDATSDKSNNYNLTNNIVLSFDTDHYVSVSSTSDSDVNDYIGLITPNNLPSLSNFSIEVDIKFINNQGICGMSFLDAITTASVNQQGLEFVNGFHNGTKGVILRPWSDAYREWGALSTDTWYTFKLIINGTSFTATINSNGSNVYSRTGTYSNMSILQVLSIYQGHKPSTLHWKNLKIKEL